MARLRTALQQLNQLLPFELFSFYHALSTLIIAVLAFYFTQLYPSSQSKWLILAAILFSQTGLRAELSWQKWWQLLYYPLCALCTAFTVGLLSLASLPFLATSTLIFIISFLSCSLGWRKRELFFSALVLNLLTILAVFFPVDALESYERAYLLILASLFVFTLRLLFYIYLKPRQFRYAQTIFFKKLKYLYLLIFYNPEQENNLLGSPIEESHFQTAWSDCLAAMQTLKNIVAPAKAGIYPIPSLERIWDLTLSLGSLRYRLTDNTVLTLGFNEMKVLAEALFSIVDKLIQASTADFQNFEQAIQNLEGLYQGTLQTIAKEPLVLLLFIQDLYALKEEFEKLAGEAR